MVRESFRRVRFALLDNLMIENPQKTAGAISTPGCNVTTTTDSTSSSTQWYTQEEINSLMVDALEAVYRWFSIPSTFEDANTNNQLTEEISKGAAEQSSLRGLEMLCGVNSEDCKYRGVVTKCAKRSVLVEQGRQKRRGVRDAGALAQASMRFSQLSTQYAVKLALEDEEYVLLDRLRDSGFRRNTLRLRGGHQNCLASTTNRKGTLDGRGSRCGCSLICMHRGTKSVVDTVIEHSSDFLPPNRRDRRIGRQNAANRENLEANLADARKRKAGPVHLVKEARKKCRTTGS